MPRKKQSDAESNIGVYCDHQRRTCILVAEDADQVEYIPLDIKDGFHVQVTTLLSFKQRYSKMLDYPLTRAAQLYLQYAKAIGGTNDVVDRLAQITSITEEDREMITSKRTTAISHPVVKKSVNKPARRKRNRIKKEVAPIEKPTRKHRSHAKAQRSTEYSSAAKMFQHLIMKDMFTDEEIFAQVQEVFGLDDSKRGYVKWYRNNLTKKGMNPPKAK